MVVGVLSTISYSFVKCVPLHMYMLYIGFKTIKYYRECVVCSIFPSRKYK